MAGAMEQASALRRKTALFKAEEKTALTGARALRAALLRAAQTMPGLKAEVERVDEQRVSLAELLEMTEAPAFIAILGGPREALGMATLSPGLIAALIEARTTGRIAAVEPAPRRTTRTDAMLAGLFIDAILADAGAALVAEPDVTWVGGYRYASYLDDPRPLGLMLEEGSYRTLRFEVTLAGVRRGCVMLALPAAGRGDVPRTLVDPMAATAPARAWRADLGEAVGAVPVRLDAVLARIELPLSTITALAPGMSIPLGQASITTIALAGLDGRRVAEGRLGQAQGQRAIRLTTPVNVPD